MSAFESPDGADRARERLEALTGFSLEHFIDTAFEENPAPDLALANLERWLRATASPNMYMEQVLAPSPCSRLLVKVLGSSQPIADAIIQNPELGALVLDPTELGRRVDRDSILIEGRRLLAASSSYLHSLDRLRFLRQRWNLSLVMNDLAGTVDQPTIWRGLSDLADVMIELAQDVAWAEYARQKEVSVRPGWMIIAFGKLGGHELNYSSDIDLVYVVEDGLDDKADRDCVRFFEALGRALSDRMGRGSLYRVDLRLRPYGGAGPISRSMRSYEAYYQLYAEPWEVQALLRSRPICGPDSLWSRWEAMRTAHCFRPKFSEISLEHMLSMKARIEEGASEGDIKRGEGGIRDVEFLTQALQMIHGYEKPDLQVRPTLDAISALETDSWLEHSSAGSLARGYTFLRKLEHRTQLVDDQQTHSIPLGDSARLGLARLMGFSSWNKLSSTLESHRRTIQTLYRSTLNLESPGDGHRAQIMGRFGPMATSVLHWFDGFPESGAFYQTLVEDEGGLDRVRQIISASPRLVGNFKGSLALTEMLLSGEILDIEDPAAGIRRTAQDSPAQSLAEAYLYAYTVVLAQWTLEPAFTLSARLVELLDALVERCCVRLGICFDILGLGSFGAAELNPNSDGDLLFLIEEPSEQPKAEKQAQDLLALFSQLKRLGAPIHFDLRLRPEGGKGLLVRTYDGLRAYDLDGMQMWERFALGHARLVYGDQGAASVVSHCAYGLPLTPERVVELAKMKRRVETERVKPQHVHRDVKLGYGGISDIEWLVHLNEMRYPTALKSGTHIGMTDRILALGRAHLLNAVESDILINAHRFLRDLRARIYLLGLEEDLLPENPDKLDRLAAACGFDSGNSLLARHQSTVEPVRRLYIEGLERLKL